MYNMFLGRKWIFVPRESWLGSFDAENPCPRIRGVNGEFGRYTNGDGEFDVLIGIKPDKFNDMILVHDGGRRVSRNEVSFL